MAVSDSTVFFSGDGKLRSKIGIAPASAKPVAGSFDPESDLYDDYNTKRFLRATRILGAVGTQGISTIQSNPFYQPQ